MITTMITTIKTNLYNALMSSIKPAFELAAAMAWISSGTLLWMAFNSPGDYQATIPLIATFAISTVFIVWRYGDMEYWIYLLKAVLVIGGATLLYMLFVNTILALQIIGGLFATFWFIGFCAKVWKL